MSARPSEVGWETRDAVKRFGDTVALNGASFVAHCGAITVLLGHNGAGKSTLFRSAVGLVRLDSGTMRITGHPAGSSRARQAVSFLPEQPDLYPGVSVWEHVAFIAMVHRLADWQARAEHLLSRFGLADRRDALPHELSQGLQRRLALVMALQHGARVLLFDEPFNGLDPHSACELRTVLKQLASGACVVVSTHLLHDAERLTDRVVLLDRGRVIAEGTVNDLERRAGLGPGAGLEDAYLTLTSAAHG